LEARLPICYSTYMYLGVDIGGTKTLVAALSEHGEIIERLRFRTPLAYHNFLYVLKDNLEKLQTKDFVAAGVGVPGRLDRENGVAISLGNLGWENVPIEADVRKLAGCPTVIENDAKMAGLSESRLLKDQYRRVLYLTVSTGIGTALVVDGKIDTNFGDRGGNAFIVEHEGKSVPWESFASGRAIVRRYGKRAEDIHDAKTWRLISKDLAIGLIDLIAMVEPEVVVFGGGVGHYLPRYEKLLRTELKRFENPMLKIPPLRKAARPEEAVVYGCYDLAKASHG
jgi:glucokinase